MQLSSYCLMIILDTMDNRFYLLGEKRFLYHDNSAVEHFRVLKLQPTTVKNELSSVPIISLVTKFSLFLIPGLNHKVRTLLVTIRGCFSSAVWQLSKYHHISKLIGPILASQLQITISIRAMDIAPKGLLWLQH